LIRWCGYSGELFEQKRALLKLIKKYNIPTIKIDNDEYEEYRNNTKKLYDRSIIQNSNNENEDEDEHKELLEEESDNDEHKEFSDEETDEEFSRIYPGVDRSNGKGKTKHVLIMPDDFKMIVMRLPTEIGAQVCRYYIELEKLIKDYMNYQMQFLSRREELLEIDLKESREMFRQAREDRERDRLERRQAETELMQSIHGLEEKVDILDDKLDIATDDRVPKTDHSDLLERFVLMRLNDPDQTVHEFYVIRTQKKSTSNAVRKLQSTFPNARKSLVINDQPNSKNLFNRIKESMRDVIDVKGNYISPYRISKEVFIDRIRSLNLEKKRIDNN
jgi:ABC-type Zn2+ transport system substrate-binding protein/surface adhesin